jgi:cytochrome c556
MDLCPDCFAAEADRYGIAPINANLWCCRARHIISATTSRSRAGKTLADERRRLAESEKREHPGDWERVRARLVALAAIADASQSHEKGSSAPRNGSGGMRVATGSNEALKGPESERGFE